MEKRMENKIYQNPYLLAIFAFLSSQYVNGFFELIRSEIVLER